MKATCNRTLLAVLFTLALVAGAGAWVLDISEDATAVPGIAPPASGHWAEGLTYISADGTLMLSTGWISPGYPHVIQRTWDAQSQSWDPAAEVLPPDSSAGYLSPDGNTLFYNTAAGILRSQYVGGAWQPGVAIFASPYHACCFNGTQLFAVQSYNDIVVSEYDSQSDTFSTPVSVTEINTPTYAESLPWVSADGLLLLFVSDRPGGYGQGDIWYATRSSTTAPWSTPVNLGPHVNTADNEGDPRLAEDADVLYFMRTGAATQGTYMQVSVEPKLTLLSPNGGEVLQAGQVEPIQWIVRDDQTFPFVQLEYRTADDQPWVSIDDAPAADGQYDWTLPTEASPTCLVRVSAIEFPLPTGGGGSGFEPTIWDVSDDYFTIYRGDTYHVDTQNGDNSNDGLTRQTAFLTIQHGIDVALLGDTVLVWPGVYNESIDLLGKSITVKSAADAAHLTAAASVAVTCGSGETADTVLENFVIRDSNVGVLCSGGSPTLRYLTVVRNNQGIRAEAGGSPAVSSVLAWENVSGDLVGCAASYSYNKDAVSHFVRAWGSLGSGDGQFDTPHAIAMDPDGNLWISDVGNDRICKYTTGGEFLGWYGGCDDPSHAGRGHWHAPGSSHHAVSGSGPGQFNHPGGIAFDNCGRARVVDHQQHRVHLFDAGGEVVMTLGSLGTGPGEFYNPQFVAVDSLSNIYVADLTNHRVQKFDPEGQFLLQWPCNSIAQGIAIDENDTVYVVEADDSKIAVFSSAGVLLDRWGVDGTGVGEFHWPTVIAVGPDGLLYVGEPSYYGVSRIQVFTRGGQYVTGFGQQGAAYGEFACVNSIFVDDTGLVYVGDGVELNNTFRNDRVQVFKLPLCADWMADDFHLLSEWGRYLPAATPGQKGLWVLDEMTSPGVDAGDPIVAPHQERHPNGGRVNVGAYGNTAYASRSEWVLATDHNYDGIVDLADFALMLNEWLVALPWR